MRHRRATLVDDGPRRANQTESSPEMTVLTGSADPGTAPASEGIRPFEIGIPEEQIDELRQRIGAARWPSKELVPDRSQGVQLATLQALARYWTTDYDWRAAEAKLNALPQFMTEIDGVEIHFIHVKSPYPDSLPLIMT